jgi:folate-binding protein YgfZ
MTSITEGYHALRESAAWFDLSTRGRIRATGEDRKRLLHALTTNHVQQLEPGQGLYAFFLNAQGRVLADAVIFCAGDHLFISTEPETRQKVYEHINHFIIADDVTLEDATESSCEFAFEGPQAAERLASLGAPLPDTEYGWTPWNDVIVLRTTSTGQPGFRLIAPIGKSDELRALLASVAPEASAGDVLAVRLEHGRPRYGDDITERYIAHETGQLHALHFQKGCYLGQEIVERVRSRGLVNRQLTPLSISGTAIPARGDKILDGVKEVGEVTSAAWSPAGNSVRALAYLRLEARNSAALHTAVGDAVQLVSN